MEITVQPALADILTLAGAAVAAALVTTFVELAKHTKGIGERIRAHELEQSLALAASLGLVVMASYDRHLAAGVTTTNDWFVSLVAWLMIGKLATGVHDEIVRKPGAISGP